VQESPAGATLPSPTPTPTPPGAQPKVRVNADTLRYDREGGTATFRGNVNVQYGQISITSEELAVDQGQNLIHTDTRFTLAQPDPKKPGEKQVVTGTGMRYNYETREATITRANLSMPAEYPGQTVYIRAKTVKGYGDRHFEASDAVFSTCQELLDELVPHYHVETKYMQYYADDKIVSWDNKVYINGQYVFWLPVWVIPLKGERNSLNIGRSEIEGFWLRSNYDYALPPMRDGFWLNDGKIITNAFERKGLGLGFEHNARWGYDAATYAFFYGLLQPDTTNLLPAQPLDDNTEAALLARNQALFGLSGTFFQDRQFGLEHRQRLPFDIEVMGRFEDHNIYDQFSPNVRTNKQATRLELKDQIPELGNLSYDLNYDGSVQRGQQVPVDPSGIDRTAQLTEPNNNRARVNTAFKVGNTDFRLSSQFDRSETKTRQVAPVGTFTVQQAQPGMEFEVRTLPGAANTTFTNNYNAASTWSPDTRSTLTVPHRISIREPAPPTPPPPGAPAAPAVPTPSPSPMEQQLEPQLDVTHKLANIGNLQVQAQKFVDLTEPPAGLTPQQEADRLRRQNKFDRLPELTLSTEPILRDFQPINTKTTYGRYFEYASIPQTVTGPINRFFPGDYINRLFLESSLGSKGHEIGLNSKLDFGGTGYRQYFYSTRDAQYAIDQRVRLVTNWTDQIESNFNYTNNVTPDPKTTDFLYRNQSPFQQDRLSLSKQTRLTGSIDVRNAPFLTYALRGGYDYQNLLYDNFSSELTYRSRFFGIPWGLTLNGQYNPADVPHLEFERKTLDIRYLPQVPLIGIAGKWEPVQGTLTIRSTEDTFGGVFGSDKILPGWQLDNQANYDFEAGLWRNLVNRLYITFGNRWQNHVQLVVGGYYDTTVKEYRVSEVGITKDLHDFVLNASYNRLSSIYSISLTMIAFPSQPLNFTSNTFNRGATGGSGFPGLP
ncbi:MAG: LptA/OstA family protein, partial [Candidatus Sericytochromatia bacterium]